jgi:hypothetical protein
MKKQKNDNLNILRWILLVPAVLFTVYFVSVLSAYIAYFIGDFEKFKTPFLIIWFLVQSVVAYFIARYIAPTHKNIAAWVSIILFPLFAISLFGLYALGF